MNNNSRSRFASGSNRKPNNQNGQPPLYLGPMMPYNNGDPIEGGYAHSNLPSDSGSSYLNGRPSTVNSRPLVPSSFTSEGSQYQQATSTLNSQDDQAASQRHLDSDPHDFSFQGAHLANNPPFPEDIYLPDPDITTGEPFDSFFVEPDPIGLGINRSETIVPSRHQDNRHSAQQMGRQGLNRQLNDALAMFTALGPPPEGQKTWSIAQQYLESAISLISYGNVPPQGFPAIVPSELQTTDDINELDGFDEPDEPAGPVEVKAHAHGKKFRCRIPGCPEKVFDLATTFQRHVETQHYARFIYACPVPGCQRTEKRRDKIVAHCRTNHLEAPSGSDIDEIKRFIPCQANCHFCSVVVRDWPAFYKCFMSHCVINDESAVDNQLTSHLNGPLNGGTGVAHGNTRQNVSNSERVGAGGLPPNANHAQDILNSQAYGLQFNQAGINPMAADPSLALNNRSASGGAGYLNPHQSFPPSNLEMPEQRRGSTGQMPPDIFRLGQTPGLQPHQQPQQTETSPFEGLQCENCGHKPCNGRCSLWSLTDRCHNCAGSGRVAARPQLNRSLASQAFVSANTNSAVAQRAQRIRMSAFPATDVGRSGRGPSRSGIHQNRPPQNGNNRNRRSNRGDPTAMMVLSVPQPVLAEREELKSARIPAMKGEPETLCLPIRGLPQLSIKTLGVEPSEPDEDATPTQAGTIDTPGPLTAVVRPTPLFECRCPCVIKATGTSYSRQAQLAPGKILDVNMKFVSEERTGHPLRTRIRVVVKLFKLHSSVTRVTRSGNKLKSKEEAKAIKNVVETSLNEPASALIPAQHEQSNEGRVDPDDSEISDTENESIFSDNGSVISSTSECLFVSEYAELPVGFYKKREASDRDGDDLLFPEDSRSVISEVDSEYQLDMIPSRRDHDDELTSSDDEADASTVNGSRLVEALDALALQEESTEFEFSMDLDARIVLNRLSSWTNGLADVDLEELSRGTNDPERVFQFFLRYLLYVMFTLSRSGYHSSPLLE